MIKHDALILSGGGAHGCWEAGFLYEIWGKVDFKEIWGTSVGGLNALCWMQSVINKSPDVFKAIWLGVRGNHDIYTHNYLKTMCARPPYSYKPLRRLLARHIQFDRIQGHTLRLNLVATDLITGDSVVLDNHSLNAGELLEAAIASANFPPVFPPVALREWRFVDGGLRANVPALALTGGKSALMLVCCATRLDPYAGGGSMIGIGTRAVDVMMNEITGNDIDVNRDTACVDIVEPDEDIGGTALDFSPARIRTGFDMGRRQALEWLATEVHGVV